MTTPSEDLVYFYADLAHWANHRNPLHAAATAAFINRVEKMPRDQQIETCERTLFGAADGSALQAAIHGKLHTLDAMPQFGFPQRPTEASAQTGKERFFLSP